jgi:hypothetical protein
MGFCGLNPKISIVRHEQLSVEVKIDVNPKKRRLLVALVSPQDEELLRLDKERENINSALKDIPGIEPVYVQDATAQKLLDELLNGADIFHFAGHGKFKLSVLDDRGGYILLLGEDGKSEPMPAESLAVNLQDRGVQLVFLGACETGRRDGQNVWSGVAVALIATGIPAVLAMQYKIWDESAIAFSRTFYKALAAGLPLEQAVSSGRIAVFNRCNSLQDKQYWRDWGVPVLYCRVRGNLVLPTIMNDNQRKTLLDEIQVGNDAVQNQSGGVNNSGTMNHSPVIQGNDIVVQSGTKYAVNGRENKGSMATGDRARAVSTHIGGNAYNSTINTAGGDIMMSTPKSSSSDIKSLFDLILTEIHRLPAQQEGKINEISRKVEAIRDEVALGQQANLNKLMHYLGYLAVIAPDIREKVVATLESPHPSITDSVRRIAADARICD